MTHYIELKVLTGDNTHLLHFYIMNMGDDDLILGYPWFVVTNAQPDWKTGTLPALVIICTKGVASEKPMCSI